MLASYARPMRRLVDRFVGKAATSKSFSELDDAINEAAAELGFSYFALVHHRAADLKPGSSLRLDNYPLAWVEQRQKLLMQSEDPVHQASRRTNVAFAWKDIGSVVALNKRQRELLETSSKFGLGDGLTVPVNIPGEPAGSFSFAMRRGGKVTNQCVQSAHIVGAYAFDAARRLYGPTPGPERPHLSRREVECVSLVAMGKSDWEIAKILGISFETVRQYLKHARRTYGVVTRTQLVVAALRDDWISLDEVAFSPASRT